MSFLNDFMMGFIVGTFVLAIVLLSSGTTYPVGYQEGFQSGVNQTLENYTCTEKELISFGVNPILLNKNVSYVYLPDNCKSIECPCGEWGCLAFCYVCDEGAVKSA